jgi:hypothetical protein
MRKMSDAHAGESAVRARAMMGMRLMIGENARAAKEAGKDHVEAGRVGGTGGQQIRGYDPEAGAKFRNIPQGAAQNGDGGIVAQ